MCEYKFFPHLIFGFWVCEDFNTLYPMQKELFHNWNTFYEKWTLVTDKLINIRRLSVKDKVAIKLIKQFDNFQQSSKFNILFLFIPCS